MFCSFVCCVWGGGGGARRRADGIAFGVWIILGLGRSLGSLGFATWNTRRPVGCLARASELCTRQDIMILRLGFPEDVRGQGNPPPFPRPARPYQHVRLQQGFLCHHLRHQNMTRMAGLTAICRILALLLPASSTRPPPGSCAPRIQVRCGRAAHATENVVIYSILRLRAQDFYKDTPHFRDSVCSRDFFTHTSLYRALTIRSVFGIFSAHHVSLPSGPCHIYTAHQGSRLPHFHGCAYT